MIFKSSRFIFTTLLTALGLGLMPAAYAEGEDGGPLAIGNFSTTLWFSNQYMFRGISNSDGPTGQGSVDWTYSGFYLGVWGSNTEFSDDDIEIDWYGGYRGVFAGIAYDVGGLYYSFPGEDENAFDPVSDSALDPGGGQEADYGEFQIILSKAFEAQWSPSVAFKYNYSPDFFGEDGDAHAVQGDAGITVPMGFLGDVGISATVGYQDVEGDKSSGLQLGFFERDGVTPLDGYDYVWWRVGVNKIIAGFKLDVSYHATDRSDDLKGFYAITPEPGDFSDLIDPSFVVTVSRSFSFP